MNYVTVDYDDLLTKGLEFDHGSGVITITSKPSEKVKCDGKKAYCGSIKITISGFQSGAVSNGDGTGSGAINGTGKLLIEGEKAVMEGDESGAITITGTTGTPASPATDYVTVKVKDAGQTKVKGA